MSKEAIKLGLMPPLTGLVSIYGEEISRAGQIACQEVNENGGVLGRPLQLVIEDDGSLPESAVKAADKLIRQHHCVAIIGNLLSNSRIAVAYQVAEPNKIPLLNFSFYEGSILSRYFFHFAALPNQQIDRMIPYMFEKFGPRMFFAGNNYEWPRGSIHAGKLALKQAGGEIVGEEYCPIGIDDITIEGLLDRVEQVNPDVFVPYFAGTDQQHLLKRFSERGLKKHMAVVMGHYDEMMASTLNEHVREGFYSCNSYFMSVDTAENRDFIARLAKFPGVTGIWPNGNGILTNFGEGTYICVKAFAKAVNLAGSLEPEALIEALKTTSLKAPQGCVEITSDHQHAQINTYLTRCEKDGGFTLIEKFGAIQPVVPDRYKHQQVSQRATLEDEIRLQARILEHMSEAVLLVSTLDGSILYTNPGAERLFGYKKGEMLGLPIATINDPSWDEPLQTAEVIIHILNMHGEWQGDIRNIKKDGSPVWCYAMVSIFTHPVHGEVWLSVHRDISQSKLAAIALQDSELYNRTLFENSPIGLALSRMDGTLKDINPAFAKIIGRTVEETKGLTYWEITPQSYGESEQEQLHQLSVKGSYGPYEKEYIHKDGRLIPVRLSGLIMNSHSEQYIWSSVEDISAIKKTEKSMRDALAALDATEDAIFIFDPETLLFSYVNEGVVSQLGYSREELLTMTPVDIKPEFDNQGYRQLTNSLFSSESKTLHFETLHRHKDGHEIPVEITLQYIKSTKDTSCFIAVVRDITERKQAEAEFRIAAAAFEFQDSLMITDVKGVVLRVNKAFTESTGYMLEDIVGKRPDMLQSGHHDAEFYQAMWESIRDTGKWQGEIWDRRKNGEVYPKLLTISAVKGSDGIVTHYVGSHMDITQKKLSDELIWKQANFDELTGLPNRSMFRDRMTAEIKRASRANSIIALLFIDLDNFKEVNDTLGHDIGDNLLKEAAQRISSCVRESDLVSRLGGDEFTVIIPELSDNAHIEKLVQKLLSQLAEPFHFGNETSYVTASIGISLYPTDATDFDNMIKTADQAMYVAKDQGRNCYSYFMQSMQDEALNRMRLNKELRQAIEQQEFILHYQPQINLATGMVTGVEALVRWQHPTKGLVPPGIFIPHAESSGLILPLGDWVMDAACRQLKQWHDSGLNDITMSINLSARQFRRATLLEDVSLLLKRTGLSPQDIELEITESLAMENPSENIKTLELLHETGIELAIDDFGTGYSSLGYLKDFPITRLKLDRSFIINIETKPSDAIIVAASINLAHALGLEVVAEGVEEERQVVFLSRLNCDVIQGYYFSKPLPADLAENFIRERSTFSKMIPNPKIQPFNALVIDDDQLLCRYIATVLKQLGHFANIETDPVNGLESLRQESEKYDLFLVDMLMPNMSGVDLIKGIRECCPETPIIVISATKSDHVRRTLKSIETEYNLFYGINYFIIEKPLTADSLTNIVNKLFKHTV